MGLRIISGDLKGRKLLSVRGKRVRPTSDRLRESIFNILSSQVQKAVVLDLFAGTGALGLEALSRGAKSVVFVEQSRSALSVIEQNILSCSLKSRASIFRCNIAKDLNRIGSAGQSFNLVFMDPPYNKELIKPALVNLHRHRLLENKTRLIVEHTALEPIPKDLAVFETVDQRRYGKTVVSFLNYIG